MLNKKHIVGISLLVALAGNAVAFDFDLQKTLADLREQEARLEAKMLNIHKHMMEEFKKRKALASFSDTGVSSILFKETKDGYLFRIFSPGAEKNSTVKVDDGIVTISSELSSTSKKSANHYTQVEKSVRSFQNSFSIPEDADAKSMEVKKEKDSVLISFKKKPSEATK